MERNLFQEVVLPKVQNLLKRSSFDSDPKKAANHRTVFISELAAMDFYSESGKILVKDSKGSQITDDQGRPLSYDQVIQNTFKKYFFKIDELNENQCVQQLMNPGIRPELEKAINIRLRTLIENRKSQTKQNHGKGNTKKNGAISDR